MLGGSRCDDMKFSRWENAFAFGSEIASREQSLPATPEHPDFTWSAMVQGYFFQRDEMKFKAEAMAREKTAARASRRKSSPNYVRRLRFAH